jgi:hypothetical protein
VTPLTADFQGQLLPDIFPDCRLALRASNLFWYIDNQIITSILSCAFLLQSALACTSKIKGISSEIALKSDRQKRLLVAYKYTEHNFQRDNTRAT